jgi:serine/threonine-protein kinase
MERKTCPNCGAAIEADRAGGLCPACLLNEGLRVEGITAAPLPECHACQNTLAEDARFCARCGTPVPAEPAAEGDHVRAALEAKLHAQYRIVRLLGRGGMGAVYLARDLALDREVAIKVLKTDSSAREVQEQLRREARTAARLSHPNIVPLHAFGEVEGMPYFVMGYVRGESLAARLRRDGRLPEEDARRILADLADALQHAHRQGVVHRDVKPDNVLLDDESGRALLTDFGVARALGGSETLTAAGKVVGTPSYMSPEQAAGRADLDGRSDIYSLGVMAYAMLSGRLPFEGKTAADVLTKHLTQPPPPLRPLAPTLPDTTVAAVERCLAKDPGRRWPDARSLRLALGVSEEPQLPDSQRAVQGQGLLAGYIVLLILAIVRAADPTLMGVLLVSAGFAAVYGIVALLLLREGLTLGQSQRTIWCEPSWWPLWYPRRLRRRGSAWDRLPALVRQVRTWPAVFLALGVIGQSDALFDFVKWSRVSIALHLGLVAVAAVSFVVWYALMLRARRQLERQGLDTADAARVVLSVPPSRTSFWNRPHIAAVLAPAPRGEGARGADAPPDQLQAILRHAEELDGPLRGLGAQAALAGRQLLAAIEHADRQIAELGRSLDAGEEARLTAKLAALGAVPGEGAAPMRRLLEKQLELVRELSARIEEGREDRNRKAEMLKTLALHLASLRARAGDAPGEVPSLSERVRALCDEIGGQSLALAEARAAGEDR